MTRQGRYLTPDMVPQDIALGPLARDVGPCVYVIVLGRDVKIGHTEDLQDRLHRYGAGAVRRLVLVEPGTYDDEQALHRRFRPFLAHGREWYAPVPHLLRWVDERRAALGLGPVDWTRYR